MRPILAIALCGLLAACETHAPSVPTVTVTCLPMANYTADFETQLAAATAALGPTNPIVSVLADYGAMRAADRACIASQGPTK